MAGAITLASIIFQGFQPINSPGQFLLSTLVIGLSILI